MDLKIRSADESDIEKIYIFEREYIIEHEKDQLHKWEKSKEKNINLLKNNIKTMFVAISKSKIIGHGYWSMYNSQPCIFSIYITKTYRNKGIATILMNKMEEQINSNNTNIVTLSTLQTNPAQYLFNKLGYKEVSRDDRWINYDKRLNLKESIDSF